MYNINWKLEIPFVTLILAVVAAYLVFFDRLPDPIPIHWNIQGEVDNTMPKSWFSALLPAFSMLGMYLLMLLFPFVDPKRERYLKFGHAYSVMRYTLIVFMALISGVALMMMLDYPIRIEKVIPPLAGIVYVIIGNYLGKTRSNWIVGVRLPWTLSSDMVWNKTNRLAGRLFVLSGLITIGATFLPAIWTFILLIGSVGLTAVVVTLYSIVLYQKEQKAKTV